MSLATQISGKHIGLLDMGSISQAITHRAWGFDIQMLYADRKKIAGLDYQQCAGLHTPAHENGFLMIATSGDEASRSIIDASVFSVMPTHTWLVNIAHNSLMDEKVLIHALQDSVIIGAGLDVFGQEPRILAVLIVSGNAVLQPHATSATQGTRQRMSEVILASAAT